jgi:tRNA nucleotidyltransferase (CCA-adding enzyme)
MVLLAGLEPTIQRPKRCVISISPQERDSIVRYYRVYSKPVYYIPMSAIKLDLKKIPKEVSYVTEMLISSGFKAYLVGGCVRNLMLCKTPKDWDITTNAKPEEIMPLFKKTVYENIFGTVAVIHETAENSLRQIEVTPFRLEAGYSDNRHPDNIIFSDTLNDDLKRRDFTINAMALDIKKDIEADDYRLIDLFNGQNDIEKKLIRSVGDANERFKEDGLRLLRAIRLSCQLGFSIEKDTAIALKNNAHLLKNISKERIREEFIKIIMSQHPMEGLLECAEAGILTFIIPELEEGRGIDQNKAHSYTVLEHTLRTLQHAADKNYSLEVRLAALFHDIGKPRARRHSKEKKEWTFYGHDVVGARMTEQALKNLKFPKQTIEPVIKLVRWHMFFSDTEQISLSAVRRMIVNVGKDHIWDLMNLRGCDRVGTGRPKENPYRLRKYKAMIEEALRDPITVGMLKINGNDLISSLKIPAGPKIGLILNALMEEVLEDPKLNTEEYLTDKARQLMVLPEGELKKLSEKGKKKKDELEEEKKNEIKKKHWVQ